MQKCNKSVRFLMIMFLVLAFVITSISLMACKKEVKTVESMVLVGDKLTVTYTDGTSEVLTLPTSIGPQGPQGEPGKDGADGQDGAPGKDGVDGAPGKDGVDGEDGKDGVDGAPGKDGVDGAPGKDGVDGAPGKDGVDGEDGKDGVGISDLVWRDGKLVAILTNGDEKAVEIPEINDCVTEKHEDVVTIRVRQDGYNDKGETDCLSGAVDLIICNKCNNCDAKVLEPTAEDHVWQPTVVAPTCDAEGYTTMVCKNCVQRQGKTDIVPALGHKWIKAYTNRSDDEPVCTHGGFLLGLCEECGHTATADDIANTDEGKAILALLVDEDDNFSNPVRVAPIGHQIEELLAAGGKAPTANEGGTLIGKCTCTGCEFSKTFAIPALNRTDYDHEIVKGKSCNESGAIKYTLSTWNNLPVKGGEWTVAGKHVKNDVEFVKAEVFLVGEEKTNKVAPNLFEGKELVCNENEVLNAGITCADCESIVHVTYRKPHDEVKGTREEKEPTCVTPGYEKFKCSVCGPIEITLPATGKHLMEYKINPVLNADGAILSYTITGECAAKCGELYGPVTAKKVVEEVTKAATCVSEGEIKYTVTLPDDNEIEIIGTQAKALHKDATGKEIKKYTIGDPYHWVVNGDNGELKLFENVVPTCDLNGFKVGFTCSVCKEIITVPATVPHKAPKGTDVPATVCTQAEADDTKNQYVCEVCEDTVKPIVVGHTFGKVIGVEEIKEGTTEKAWYAVKECSVCKHKEYLNNGEPIVIAEGAEPTKSQASSCVKAGYDVYDVEVKDGDVTVVLPITIVRPLANHKYVNLTEITPEEREKIHALDGIDNPLGIYYYEGQKSECSGNITECNGGVVCPICDQIIPLKVSAPHNWGAEPETGKTIKSTAATCTKAEVIERYCLNCNAWKVDEAAEVDKALGHSYKATIVTEPTENAAGSATVTCTRCSDINETITLPKLSDSAWKKTVEAKTCVKDGKVVYTANLKIFANSDDTVKIEIINTIPADGHHDFIMNDGKVATSVWYTVDKHDANKIVVTKYVGSYCQVEKLVIVTDLTTLDKDGTALTEADIPAGAEVIDISAEFVADNK